jgi:hypothetical protein
MIHDADALDQVRPRRCPSGARIPLRPGDRRSDSGVAGAPVAPGSPAVDRSTERDRRPVPRARAAQGACDRSCCGDRKRRRRCLPSPRCPQIYTHVNAPRPGPDPQPARHARRPSGEVIPRFAPVTYSRVPRPQLIDRTRISVQWVDRACASRRYGRARATGTIARGLRP